MNAFLNRFTGFVAAEKLFSAKDHLLLAVSGGMDSVVLCDIIHRLGYTFSIAHCNFTLRGEESDRDEAFVKELADHYHASFHCQAFETSLYASKNKCSIQEAARQLRYSWFNDLIQELSQKNRLRKFRLLTAHHRDDNIETLLMNFFKGTGIAGLRGMRPATDQVIRPLLFASRVEIETYAREAGLQWVEDSSNLEDKYSRNYFRHQVIPLVEKIYPKAMDNLSDNLFRFREIEQLYQLSVGRLLHGLAIQKGVELHIPVEKLRLSPAVHTLIFEMISPYGFHASQIVDVLKLMESQTGKYVLSSSHRILKNRNWLIIAPLQSIETGIILIESFPSMVNFPGGSIRISASQPPSNETQSSSEQIVYINGDEIQLPLILRRWKTGDYFYPLGMRKKKKISRFLIDQKISRIEKENIWVIESDKRIIWIAGKRLDERFKVVPATKQILKIHLDSGTP